MSPIFLVNVIEGQTSLHIHENWYATSKYITFKYGDITVQKPMSTRLAGTPKIRWENHIKEDLRIMKINEQCIQDWVEWNTVVQKAKTFSVVVAPGEEETEDIKVLILLLESFFLVNM